MDIAKGKHYACVVSACGEALFSRAVPNDEAAIRRMIDDAGDRGRPALVVDMTSSAAVLTLTVAAEMAIPVAYVSGLAMRRAADLYAGAAKTDPKDAQVLADVAWRNADRLTWTTVTDELLARLRILNGRDTDLASDATRAANRLRDALLAVSPALERAVGDRLVSAPGLRAALVKYPTPTALRTAGKAQVRTLISKRSKRTAATLTDQIWGRPSVPDRHRRCRSHLGRNNRRLGRRPGPDHRPPEKTRRRHRGSLLGASAGKSP